MFGEECFMIFFAVCFFPPGSVLFDLSFCGSLAEPFHSLARDNSSESKSSEIEDHRAAVECARVEVIRKKKSSLSPLRDESHPPPWALQMTGDHLLVPNRRRRFECRIASVAASVRASGHRAGVAVPSRRPPLQCTSRFRGGSAAPVDLPVLVRCSKCVRPGSVRGLRMGPPTALRGGGRPSPLVRAASRPVLRSRDPDRGAPQTGGQPLPRHLSGAQSLQVPFRQRRTRPPPAPSGDELFTQVFAPPPPRCCGVLQDAFAVLVACQIWGRDACQGRRDYDRPPPPH
jgi:hypothetical protein